MGPISHAPGGKVVDDDRPRAAAHLQGKAQFDIVASDSSMEWEEGQVRVHAGSGARGNGWLRHRNAHEGCTKGCTAVEGPTTAQLPDCTAAFML